MTLLDTDSHRSAGARPGLRLFFLAAALAMVQPGPDGALHAQETEIGARYITRPLLTPYGIVTGNSLASALYLDRQGPQVLVEGPGTGIYFTLAPDARRLGFKQIDRSGRQSPSEVDLATGTVKRLWPPSPRAGQVSYANDGTVAFTVDTTLVLLQGSNVRRVGLGTYANLCPISPDGRWAVFNTEDDQLWLLDITAGQRRLITDGRFGYVNPRWSPDARAVLFSSLHGQMMVYHLDRDTTAALGEGWGAVWSPDSRGIAFYRTEIREGRLVNSDLYLIAPDGSGLRRLTETPGRCEMDPSFTRTGSGLLYHTRSERSVHRLELSLGESAAGVIPGESSLLIDSSRQPLIRPPGAVPDLIPSIAMDIPYVHQVYDTPDWFNGHWACAPTQAIMVLAYYGVLPPWETTCSWPVRHVTAWGAYVAESYQFRQTAYTFTANDPSGVPGRGGYGFMWTGSWSPHSRMAEYFRKHGMSAEQTEGTPYATAAGEVVAGYPLSMCVMLTDAGHLVLAHGLGAEPHTFVFNDPYGDKNRGYVNYTGKDVRYDWPGYNNGYQNLNGVAWCIATRFSAPASNDTLIDDLQFSRGFSMQTSAPASMYLWKDLNRGYDGHLWFATTRERAQGDVCSAEWRPTLPVAGMYEVSAYVALSNATSAIYRIHHGGGDTIVVLNQNAYTESWAPIGTFPFQAGQSGSVSLGDASDSAGQELVFDALRWRLTEGPATAIAASARPSLSYRLSQNYPNPFNPSTTVRFALAERSVVRLEVFDALGARVASLAEGERQGGVYEVHWDAGELPSGIYLCWLRASSPEGRIVFSDSRKLLLLR